MIEHTITEDNKQVTIQVKANDDDLWHLQITDAEGNTTVWEDLFNSAEEAMQEGKTAVAEEGIDAFIGDWGQV